MAGDGEAVAEGIESVHMANASILNTSLQLFTKIKIQTHLFLVLFKRSNKKHTKEDEFVSIAYYT